MDFGSTINDTKVYQRVKDDTKVYQRVKDDTKLNFFKGLGALRRAFGLYPSPSCTRLRHGLF